MKKFMQALLVSFGVLALAFAGCTAPAPADDEVEVMDDEVMEDTMTDDVMTDDEMSDDEMSDDEAMMEEETAE